ncbi:MAG: ATP-dependent protease ATPase subunit HslU [Christensenellaceae bacterium]|nr:ATP-dependent protease ATPase subunit HslU [Christensenellaceae bacterium]MDD6926421.1 ATP-dependent protease ATPase subunit HslU [bacterium]MDY2850802.1 ATP-dependent protease ATPase subunit HslU [Christensenellaceae bacterium]
MGLTPRQIVFELDKYIVGQSEAKRAVAVALRNRYRRSQLSPEIMEEITPKNIIMKGPTGVGKTEIARRLAKLVKAPFVKVEATKFTEVGYVGRDVESMIRDLVECSVRLVKEEQFKVVSAKATAAAEKVVLNSLMVLLKDEKGETPEEIFRNRVLENLRTGKYDKYMIEIEVSDVPKPMELVPGSGTEINLGSIFDAFTPKKKKRRKVSVKEAMNLIVAEESDKLIDMDAVNAEAVKRAENEGIVFIDEIDKIAGKGNASGGPDVSREGVQRDILPIVEGSTVITKYGPVKTDYILFIAAGAFHVSSVSDLIPEFQGRFPVLVELNSLTKEDFINILTVPENAVTSQYKQLLRVDNIDLKFTDGAIEKIAEIAAELNETSEDIGARRLHTVLEQILSDISYNAGGDYPMVETVIDENYVTDHMPETLKSKNLKKYIL